MNYGAIFDADGTLLNSMQIWEEAAVRCLQTLGYTADRTLTDAVAQMSLEEGVKYIKQRLALPLTTAELQARVLDAVRQFYLYEVQAKVGVPTFLAQMQASGIPMVIATSGSRELVLAALIRLKLSHYFGRIFFCGEVGAGKEQPNIYFRAAKFLGLPPRDIFVFEDALYAVRTANLAGFRTVGVFDAASVSEREALQHECGLYLHDFTEFAAFQQYVPLI